MNYAEAMREIYNFEHCLDEYEPPSDDYRDIEPEYIGDGFTEEYEWQPSDLAMSFVRGDDPYGIWS